VIIYLLSVIAGLHGLTAQQLITNAAQYQLCLGFEKECVLYLGAAAANVV
jgi:hypothetical protein